MNDGADASKAPFKVEEEGDVFAVLHNHACDDFYDGYNDGNLIYSAHHTFKQAKESVDKFETNIKPWSNGYIQVYDGVDWEPYITIVKMKFGDNAQREEYCTMVQISKNAIKKGKNGKKGMQGKDMNEEREREQNQK